MNLTNFAGQNWLITPVALAAGEPPPKSIHEQKWLLVLTGVVAANLEGNSTSNWLNANLSFLPEMAGPNDAGPLNWAIDQYHIPKPTDPNYAIGFALDEWAPFVSLSAIYDQHESIEAGYAVKVWRPNHFSTGIDAFSDALVGGIFTGVNADVAVRDTDAWILSLGYNITLRGRIVFTRTPLVLFESNFETTAQNQKPSLVQAVGTAMFNGPNLVISPSFLHSGNWLRIGPLTDQGGQFTGEFTDTSVGAGVYTISALMYMSSESADSYLVFSPGPNSNPFFTLIFSGNNNEVLDGGLNATGCTFPRDIPFAIMVILTVTSGFTATAQVFVAGTAANIGLNQIVPSFSSISFGQNIAGGKGFDVAGIVVKFTAH